MTTLEQFPDDWSRALVLMAHPDDPEYGTAIAVNAWTRSGKEVSYVLATSGEAGIESLPPAQAGPAREIEQRRAIARVGVRDLEFLGFPDGRTEYGLALREAFAGAIRRYRPEVVVTLNFGLAFAGGSRNQADHRAVGLAALDAVADAGNSWIFPGLAGEPWAGVRHIAVCADSDPTHTVEVTDGDLDAATAALLEHRQYLEGLGVSDVEAHARAQVERGVLSDGAAHRVSFRVYQ
ncbi:PIG-L deacetylase family protein [Leucobacter luti]|uniref:LmbE family N-acetylglucosaminyl deacetylase n=1 Tax=Leucobacter luti TaxID=340320 RepID=A0A4Q7U103_9MICO|nr:PIG-L family deacetylase [Leucobacter luti]MBL3699564.1 PIG-L family deacetylase [Leucobacter luti]RZT67076.1 LmbE family N-acetylglucosaminyl deacetylase [Leucobacter luti]